MSKLSVVSKGIVLASVITLTLVLFSTTTVLAATPNPSPHDPETLNQDLEARWAMALSSLRVERIVYKQFRILMDMPGVDKKTPAFRQADNAARNFNVILREARKIADKHSGFDSNGRVTDRFRAGDSVRRLDKLLQKLRGSPMDKLTNALTKLQRQNSRN